MPRRTWPERRTLTFGCTTSPPPSATGHSPGQHYPKGPGRGAPCLARNARGLRCGRVHSGPVTSTPLRETLPEHLARLYPDGAPAGLVPVRLVPVEVFGGECPCHEAAEASGAAVDHDFVYGLCDAVEAWSDCNRAYGRIYRRDEDESRRLDGDTITVWVSATEVEKFNKRFGD